ncbi:MAG: hypothetical protein WC683_15050 [bacterium]
MSHVLDQIWWSFQYHAGVPICPDCGAPVWECGPASDRITHWRCRGCGKDMPPGWSV